MVVYETRNGDRWFRVDQEAGTRIEISGPGGEPISPSTGGEAMEPDPYGIYGDTGGVRTDPWSDFPDRQIPGAGGSYPQPELGINPVATSSSPAIAITLGWLVARLGSFVGRSVFNLLRGLTFGRGGRISWSRLPSWVRQALVGIGIVEGTDVVLDLANIGPDGGGLPAIPGLPTPDIPEFGPRLPDGSFEPPQLVDGIQVIGTWTANGTLFARLADGKLAARNKHGRWKTWRPKKPIVLYSTGAADLPHLLRADRAVARQVKRLNEAIDRRKTRTVTKCFRCGKAESSCRCKLV